MDFRTTDCGMFGQLIPALVCPMGVSSFIGDPQQEGFSFGSCFNPLKRGTPQNGPRLERRTPHHMCQSDLCEQRVGVQGETPIGTGLSQDSEGFIKFHPFQLARSGFCPSTAAN